MGIKRHNRLKKNTINKIIAGLMIIVLLPFSDMAGLVNAGNDVEAYGDTNETDNMKLSDNWIVTKDYKLTKDVQVSELDIKSGCLDLNGHKLEVSGNVNISGRLKFRHGSLVCGGDFSLEESADIYMRNESDYLDIKGNFIDMACDSDKTVELKNGKISVSGQLITGKRIDFGEDLEQEINLSDKETDNWTLGQDEIVCGDLKVGNGVVDLNGHTLTVYGNAYITEGQLNINHGKLLVKGKIVTGYNTYIHDICTTVSGHIIMENEDDYIEAGDGIDLYSSDILELKKGTIKNGSNLYVYGDVLFGCDISSEECNHDAGTMYISGTFEIKDYTFGHATGIELQHGSFINYGGITLGGLVSWYGIKAEHEDDYVCFYNDYITFYSDYKYKISNGTVEIKNEEVNINFPEGVTVILSGDTKQYVSGKASKVIVRNPSFERVKFGKFECDNIIYEETDKDERFKESELSKGGTLEKDKFMQGDFTLISGELDLNGHTLFISGNFYHYGGEVKINNGKLIIGKNYEGLGYGNYSYYDEASGNYESEYAVIIMTEDNDYLQIIGDYINTNNVGGSFYNGIIEIKGNVTGYLYTYENNKLILSGNDEQKISLLESGYRNQIKYLEIKNTSEAGVILENSENVYINTLITNENIFRHEKGRTGWKLTSDETVEGDLMLYGGCMDLNGHTLTVTGDFIFNGGELIINGGALVVEEDCTFNSYDYGYMSADHKRYSVIMNNVNDRIKVSGNFYAYIYGNTNADNNISNGKIIVGGDISGGTFISENTEESVVFELNSDIKQCIHTGIMKFRKLIINNTSNIPVSSSASVTVIDELNIINGSISDVTVKEKDVANMNNYIGNINYNDNYINDEIHNINGDLTIKGNAEINGELNVQGDLKVERDLTVNGKLNVQGDIFVGGKLVQAGEMKVAGNAEIKYGINIEKDCEIGKDLEAWYYTMSISNANVKIGGNLHATINVNGTAQNETLIQIGGNAKLSGSINGNSTVMVKGDTEVTDITVTSGKLISEGNISADYYIKLEEGEIQAENIEFKTKSRFIMKGDTSCISVNDFKQDSTIYSNIEAGTINISGDIRIKNEGGINAYGTSVINIKGKGEHLISSINASNINILNIEDKEAEIYINKSVTVKELNDNGATVVYTDDALKLTEDMVINGNVAISAGSLNLNGYKLTVKGNFKEFGGNIIAGDGGILEVQGDFYGYSEETNELGENGRIDIIGNMYVTRQCIISGGTTTIAKNIYNLNYKRNYNSIYYDSNLTVNGELILQAENIDISRKTEIHADTLTINSKTINKAVTSDAKYETVIYANKSVKMDYLENGDNIKLIIPSINVIDNDVPLNVGSVVLSGSNETEEDESKYECDWDIDINGNLTVYNPLKMGGYSVKANNITVYGNLIMDNENAYLLARKDLYLYKGEDAKTDILTAGTIEVTGNMSCYRDYISSEEHRTKLSRPLNVGKVNSQILYIYTRGDINVRFGKLVLTRRADSSSYSLPNNLEKYCDSIIYEYDDNVPPRMNGQLKAESIEMQEITLSFSKASDSHEISGYYIYRDGEIITDIKETKYTDTGLMPGTSYCYEVRAYDDCNNLAEKGLVLNPVTLSDTEPPSKVTGFAVSKRSGSSITLNWNSSTDNTAVKGYNIYRNGEKIKDCAKTVFYKDTGLEKNTVYEYTIEAVDLADNVSEKSGTVKSYTCMPEINKVSPSDKSTIGKETVNIQIFAEDNSNQAGYTAKIEYRHNSNTWTAVEENININERYRNENNKCVFRGMYDWNISELKEDGEYDVRITIYDEDNNSTSQIITYSLDRTPPALPKDITGVSDNGVNIIKYQASHSADCAGYIIYRKAEDETEYTRYDELKGQYETEYHDSRAEYMVTYDYAVSVYDNMGNESILSEPVSIRTLKDREAPKVTGIYPTENRINGEKHMEIFATDNIGVKTIKLWYTPENRTSESTGEEAVLIGEAEALNNKASIYFDTKILEDGNYIISATATDMAGNESLISNYGKTYEIDNKGPEKVIMSECKSDATNIQLRWEDVADEDFSYFVAEELKDGETVKTFNAGNVLGYNITGLIPGETYSYRVIAYDNLGNRGEASDIITLTTTADNVQPVITEINPVQSKYRDRLELSMKVSDNYSPKRGEFLWSSDGENYTSLGVVTDESVSQTKEFGYTMNLSDIPEGKIYIKFMAYDHAGNRSALAQGGKEVVAVYIVDRTAPDAPKGVTASGENGNIRLSWDSAIEDDVKYYNIYRAEEENGEYTLRYGKLDRLSLYDTDIKPDKLYFYKVSATDIAGNESTKSNTVSAKALKDTEAPKIVTLSPENNATVGKNAYIRAAVTDNTAIDEIHLEYRDAEDQMSVYKELTFKKSSEKSDILEVSIGDAELSQGKYYIRAYATDTFGNVSEYITKCINIDTTAPECPEFTCESGGYKVTLNIDATEDTEVNAIKIYRAELLNGRYSYLSSVSAEQGRETIYTDNTAKPGIMYCYKIEVSDKYGNSTMSKAVTSYATDEDTEAPQAVLGETITTIEGYEISLDGGASTDNVRVTEYEWNMGNGDVIYGVSPVYAYEKEGVYTVRLKVKDAAGNSSTAEMTVIVLSNKDHGRGTVHVTDNKGVPIAYADVYVQRYDGSTVSMKTDGRGDVVIADKEGVYKVSAYASGFLPTETDIRISRYGETEKTIVLQEGDVAVGELKVERMSLQEIIDAGVDISNPDNLNICIVTVSIKLEKSPIPTVIEYISGGGNGAGSDEDECIIKSIGGITYDEDSSGVSTYKEELPKVVRADKEEPIFAFIQTSTTATWLKDMYNVNLTILNAAEPSFTLKDCQAKLNLPDGVSLAVTRDKQSLYSQMGDISGQQKKTVNWIVKGDRSGKYSMSADFCGTLMPFERNITGHFEAEKEFDVRTGEGLHVMITAEDSAYIDENYYIQFEIKNESDRPFYNFHTTLGKYIDSSSDMGTSGTGQIQQDKESDSKENNNDNNKQSQTFVDKMFDNLADSVNKAISQQATAKSTEKSEDVINNTEQPHTATTYNVSGGNTQIPVLSGNDILNISALAPGESVYGTFRQKFTATGNPEDEYYRAVQGIAEVIKNNVEGVKVTLYFKPSRISRTKTEYEEIPTHFGDPVDLTTGAFTDSIPVMEVSGVFQTDFNLEYNSGLCGNAGENGYGFHNNHETQIKDKKGIITLKLANGVEGEYIKRESIEGKYSGKVNGNEIYPDAGDTCGEYESISSATSDYRLTKNTDGTYTVTTPAKDIYTYDEQGRNIKIVTDTGKTVNIIHTQNQKIITDTATGNRMKLTYNEYGKIISVSDDTGREATFTYDGDRLTSYTNVMGETTTFTYDAENRILTETDCEGITYVSNTYDEKGRVTAQYDADHTKQPLTISYEEKDNITVIKATDALGNTGTMTADYYGRVLTQTNARGSATLFGYDINGHQVMEKDALGGTVLSTYDEQGRKTEVTDQSGNKTTFTYDNRDNLIKVTDGRGNTSTYEYNEKNLLTCVTDYNGAWTKYEYNSDGQVIKESREDLGSRTYVYTKGNLTSTTDYNGNTTTMEYDNRGCMTKKTDALGNVTTYTYDKMLRQTSQTDALGGTQTYTYDKYGNIISQTDEKGRTTIFEYGLTGEKTAEKLPDGTRTEYEYDALGNVTKITTGITSETENGGNTEVEDGKVKAGKKQGKVEDENSDILPTKSEKTSTGGDKLQSEIEKSSKTDVQENSQNVTTYTYDSEGNIISQTNAKGETITYTYDLLNRKISETNTSGETISYKYYGNGKPSEKTYPDGTRELYTYDKNWNLLRVTDTLGGSTTYTYDNADRVTEERDAYGNKLVYEYNREGKITKATDKRGNTTSYTYDSEGNCLTVKTADGTETKYEYDALNRPISKTIYTEENGDITVHYEYDALSRLTKITDAEGETITYTYDKVGNLIKETDRRGNTTTYVYDSADRLIKTINADGTATENEYDSQGLLTKKTGYAGTEKETATTYRYDSLGRLTSFTDPLEGTTACIYDKNGNITSVTDAGGGTVTYTYDSMCRPTSEKNSMGAENTYTYNAQGLLEESTNAKGNKTAYEYDRLGRITKATDEAGEITYTYDANGNITETAEKKADGTTDTITRTYDVMNRVTAATDSRGNTIRYGYDELGNILTITYPGGEKIRYSYYRSGRIKTVTDSRGRATYYTYDSEGNITETTRPDGSREENTYDSMSRLTSKTDITVTGKVISKITYEYDIRGNITKTTQETAGKEQTENLEILGEDITDKTALQLTMMSERLMSGDKAEKETEAGEKGDTPDTSSEVQEEKQESEKPQALAELNAVSKTEPQVSSGKNSSAGENEESGKKISSATISSEGNTGSGKMKVTTLEMKYDKANRLISYNGIKVKYDKDGNMTYGPVNGEMTELKYDCRNRLIKAGDTTYEYNAENTRTAKEEKGTRTEYTTDTNSTLSQVLEAKTTKEDGTEETTTYIYGNGLLYENTSENLKIHHYDNLGSTTALTDEKGNIITTYTYGTYGEILSGDTTQTPYLYNGQFGVETDKNNLYYMRARYYNVNIKRFINQDTERGTLTNSQSLNRYSYVQGNPVSLTDPFGLSPLANISWKTLGHAVLNGLGMIPGIGDAFDLVNAAWYLADGDYKNALLSGICALPFVGDIIGTGVDIMGAAKAAKFVKTASRAISYAATFTQATGGAVRGMKDVWKNAKDGKFFTKQNAIDMAGVAINTFTALCSGKSAYKYGSETVGMLKTSVADVWSGIKKQASVLYNDNGGYLNLGGNGGGIKTVNGYDVIVNVGQQNKHILGTNENKVALNNGQNKSIIYGDLNDIQKLLNDKAGTGKFIETNKERVNFGKVIGQYINPNTGDKVETMNGIIHYGKKGAHIVPAKP